MLVFGQNYDLTHTKRISWQAVLVRKDSEHYEVAAGTDSCPWAASTATTVQTNRSADHAPQAGAEAQPSASAAAEPPATKPVGKKRSGFSGAVARFSRRIFGAE
jgi:hypothetical protein